MWGKIIKPTEYPEKLVCRAILVENRAAATNSPDPTSHPAGQGLCEEQSSTDAPYGHENPWDRGSSHPKPSSDYTLYKEAIPVKGLGGEKETEA